MLKFKIQMFAEDPPPEETPKGLINERLLKLESENRDLKLEIEEKDKEIERLQLDYAGKIADLKLDFQTKEISYKKQIKECKTALEMRSSVQEEIDKNKGKKGFTQIWDEVVGKK